MWGFNDESNKHMAPVYYAVKFVIKLHNWRVYFLQTKEFLKDPSKFAAVAAAATAAPAESAAPAAAAETKKEESEESDDDMGFGLFDWVAPSDGSSVKNELFSEQKIWILNKPSQLCLCLCRHGLLID